MTAAQRSKAVKRRKEIWEALHPVSPQRFDSVFDALPEAKDQVEPLVPPEFATGYKRPPPQEKAFAAETAEASGMTKQAINRHISRAEALGDDLDKVTGTSLDKGVELDALKAMPPEQRACCGPLAWCVAGCPSADREHGMGRSGGRGGAAVGAGLWCAWVTMA